MFGKANGHTSIDGSRNFQHGVIISDIQHFISSLVINIFLRKQWILAKQSIRHNYYPCCESSARVPHGCVVQFSVPDNFNSGYVDVV
jgi:hypothetical protein